MSLEIILINHTHDDKRYHEEFSLGIDKKGKSKYNEYSIQVLDELFDGNPIEEGDTFLLTIEGKHTTKMGVKKL